MTATTATAAAETHTISALFPDAPVRPSSTSGSGSAATGYDHISISTEEKTGMRYKLVGDYYFLAGDEEPEERRPIGIWGQRHLRYIRQCKKATYTALLIEGKLPDYLADVNEQAENFLTQTVKEMAKAEGVDEAMKRRDPLGYVA